MRRTAGWCVLLIVPLLASCAWMPGHRKADAEPAPVVAAPASAASTAAAPPAEKHGWLPWHWGHKHAAADASEASAPAPAASAAPVAAAAGAQTAAPAVSESAPAAPAAAAEPAEKHGWLPWHWGRKHKAAPPVQAPAPAASAAPVAAAAPAVVPAPAPAPPPAPEPAPAPVASAPSVPAPSVAASTAPPAPASVAPAPSPRPVAPTQGEYAPLDEIEWRELFEDYRVLAQCEDRYMNSAGLNSIGVGQRLVLMGKAGALRADALHLLDPDSPLRAQWRQPAAAVADTQAKLASDTLLALMADAPAAGLGRELARKATARYYVAQVTGRVCNPGARYPLLMRKAGL